MKLPKLTVALLLLGSAASAQDVSHCVGIKDPDDRLNCFDQAFVQTETLKGTDNNAWDVRVNKSALDDSTTVVISTTSSAPIRSRFDGMKNADLLLRCKENTTSAYFIFAGQFMSDIQGFGRIDYRVDDTKAKHVNARASTDNEALGLWNGGSAIPFIKGIMGGNSLYVRATPYNESMIEMTFPISGLEEAIKPLREACHW